MDIEELSAQKKKMEVSIRNAVHAAIREFRVKTGYSPSSIDIHLIDVRRLGEQRANYMVDQVRSDIVVFGG